MGAPQLGQNFAPGAVEAWQFGHVPAAGAAMPQFGQNFAPAGICAWHFEQVTIAPAPAVALPALGCCALWAACCIA